MYLSTVPDQQTEAGVGAGEIRPQAEPEVVPAVVDEVADVLGVSAQAAPRRLDARRRRVGRRPWLRRACSPRSAVLVGAAELGAERRRCAAQEGGHRLRAAGAGGRATVDQGQRPVAGRTGVPPTDRPTQGGQDAGGAGADQHAPRFIVRASPAASDPGGGAAVGAAADAARRLPAASSVRTLDRPPNPARPSALRRPAASSR